MRLIRKLSSGPIRSVLVQISEEVRAAKTGGNGVLALETTVLTHGLPYPKNFEVAQEVERVVRSEGCIPAAIGVYKGAIRVGLNLAELETFCKSKNAIKVSRADLSRAVANGLLGGTTVSGTMFGANIAGIPVFATGGIGGVHRGVAESWDISGDLRELGRTPVTVVCAGVKSILDVGKTLEYLETEGVPVITYGANNAFPGFFSSDSGFKSKHFTNDLNQIVQMIRVSEELGLKQGRLVACPIPEEYEASGKEIENAVQEALEYARKHGIKGQAVTPFILKTVNDITEGRSQQANVILLKNNARIGAKLANKLASKSDEREETERIHIPTKGHTSNPNKMDVTVIGGCNVDYYVRTDDPNFKSDGSSYNGRSIQVCGGVGRNHADALTRFGLKVAFVSAVGNDTAGQFVRDYCSHMDLSNVVQDGETSTYAAFIRGGEVMFGVQTPNSSSDFVTPALIKAKKGVIANSKYLLLDGNISVDAIRTACDIAHFHNVSIWYEPTDKHKVKRIFEAGSWEKISYVSPNYNELLELFSLLKLEVNLEKPPPVLTQQMYDSREYKDKRRAFIDQLTAIRGDRALSHISTLVVTSGTFGGVVLQPDKITFEIPPAVINSDEIVSTSGAGDCLNSVFLAGWVRGQSMDCLKIIASACAERSLLSYHPIPRDLDEKWFREYSDKLTIQKQL